jgi:hypothetical protein
MAFSTDVFGPVARGLHRFAAQVAVSIAATICATALYGHLVSDRSSVHVPSEPASSRVEGGVIEARTLAYYPEHLAALDSLSRFQPVSAQRTAELAGASRMVQTASLLDTARLRHLTAAAVLPPSRPAALTQIDVLPPRRPVALAAPAPITVAENPAETVPSRKIWGVELPHFVPTGAAVMDKLASMKERIGGLIHVSSR